MKKNKIISFFSPFFNNPKFDVFCFWSLVGICSFISIVPVSFLNVPKIFVYNSIVDLHEIIIVFFGIMFAIFCIKDFLRNAIPQWVLFSGFFLMSLIVSSFVPETGLKEGLKSSMGLFFRGFLISYAVFSLCRVRKTLDQTIHFIRVIGVIVSVGALYEYFSGDFFIFERIVLEYSSSKEVWTPLDNVASGSIGFPIALSVFLIVIIPFYFEGMFKNKVLSWSAFFIVSIAIFLTFKRSGYALWIVNFMFFLHQKDILKVHKKILIFLTGVVLLGSFYFISHKDGQFARFSPSYILQEINSGHRAKAIFTGWRMFKKSSFLGIGTRQYSHEWREFSQKDDNINTPDNQYLRVFSENGMLGIISVILMLGYLVKKTCPLKNDPISNILFISILNFLISLFIIDGFYWPACFMIFMVVCGVSLAYSEMKKKEEPALV
ncbi:MAG: O-antigen ligase family protein [Elusimicrobiota bacterium]